jgi:hypothetical protein
MAAIHRRSHRAPISVGVVLADADDVDGLALATHTYSYDITGASRAFIVTLTGTTGTAGVDVVCYSKDGGLTWSNATDLLLASANDVTGTVQVNGALEVAGVDPVTVPTAVFKCGPFEGPTAIRVVRKTGDATGAITWVSGAPAVYLYTVGQTSGSPVAVA